ncbi:condensation domain-containing protein [Lysinibacillus xylanilyticus]|uniref:condensation domain-containing protein n=1 Tax=Lysinibacillus xylanilyticus TaxID=582475 RepID=UPI0037F74536
MENNREIENVSPVSLPRDYESSEQVSMNSINKVLPNYLADNLIYLSKDSDFSLYLLLLTCLKITLAKQNAIKSVPIESVSYLESLSKPITILERLEDEETFTEFLFKVKNTTIDACEKVNNANFNSINSSSTLCVMKNIHDITDEEKIKKELALIFNKVEKNIEIKIMYDAGLFDLATINLFYQRFIRVLEQVSDNHKIKINNIEIFLQDEKNKILKQYSNIKNIINEKLLCDQFYEQVKRSPEKIAIKHGENALTYKELNKLSNQLGMSLREQGVKRDTIVAILCDRSIDMVVGILATLKAGGAYIPIDVNYPTDRIKEILVDSKVEVLITMSDLFNGKTFGIKDLIVYTELKNIVFIDNFDEKVELETELKTIELAENINEEMLNNYYGDLAYDNVHFKYEEYLELIDELVLFIEKHNLQNSPFGILVTNPVYKIISVNALYKTKSEVIFIDTSKNQDEVRLIIEKNQIKNIISETVLLDKFNELFWTSNELLCHLLIDNYDNKLNRKEENFKLLWENIGEKEHGNVNDYGWVSSYDGKAFSIEEMEEYTNNFSSKIAPFLNNNTKVLEIGCGHGLVFSEIADKVGSYHATDISSVIINKNREIARNKGLENVKFSEVSAIDISQLNEKNLDVIICSSVIHYFPDTYYLEKVIKSAIDLIGDNGVIYLDDIIDLNKKKELIHSLEQHKMNNPKDRTKLNWENDLFVDVEFFKMIENKYPEVIACERSEKLGKTKNELNEFRYDVVLKIDKSKAKNKNQVNSQTYKMTFDISDIKKMSNSITVPTMDMPTDYINEKHSKFSITDKSDIKKYPTNNLEIINEFSDLSYVIYTSGTTGKPKGAMVEHRGMINHINAKISDFYLSNQSNIAQTASQSFDISIWQIFSPLMVGGTSVIYSNDVIEDINRFLLCLEKDNISVLQVVPTYLSAMLEIIEENTNQLSMLSFLCVTGEEVKKHVVNKWFSLLPNIPLVNAYGPTEVSDDITHFIMKETPKEKLVPVGKPIQNTNIYILDEFNNLLPIGVPGHICVSGIGVGRGYLNNDGLTKEKFVLDPFATDDKRMYKTGDLGRWLNDGNIEFLGRIDNQIKIRGYRIEIEEIENKIRKHENVKEVVVIDLENNQGEKHICAYVVSFNDLKEKDLKSYLEERLPSYMVPSYIFNIQSIPTTINGKIDKKSLPNPFNYKSSSFFPPKTYEEKLLADIWEKVLMTNEKVGIKDNYFELGGDSIKAIQISANLQKSKYKLEIQDIFNNPTIEELGVRLRPLEQKIDQGEVTGVLDMTPIQLDFFGRVDGDINLYNQSILLLNRKGFNKDILEDSFTRLVEHHDALRMKFKKNGEVIEQFNEGVNKARINIPEFNLIGAEYLEKQIVDISKKIQKTINIYEGELVKLGLFKTSIGDYLLISIHHLVVDGYSWRIILEDLFNLYEQLENNLEPILPEKTHSYMSWSNELVEYSKSEKALKEIDFWNGIENSKVPTLPVDRPITENLVKDQGEVSTTLGTEYTESLMYKVPSAYNTEINDVLIASLLLSIKEWTNQNQIKINMEGHGRENIIDEMNISRTVGWFTSVFPMLFNLSEAANIASLIKETKETIRRVPNKGIGYGILKFLSSNNQLNKEKSKDIAEIGFNYLGEVNNQIDGLIELCDINLEVTEDSMINREFGITINAVVHSNNLKISIEYNKLQYDEETINNLLSNYKQNLISLINHCLNQEESQFTVSDFSDEDLSEESIEAFFEQFEENFK